MFRLYSKKYISGTAGEGFLESYYNLTYNITVEDNTPTPTPLPPVPMTDLFLRDGSDNDLTNQHLSFDNIELPDSFQLYSVISPSNATLSSRNWSSSNPNVATVSYGYVSLVGVGSTRISLTASDRSGNTKTVYLDLDVSTPHLQGVKITDSSGTDLTNKRKEFKNIDLPFSYQLNMSKNPTNAGVKNITWSSANKNIATVSENGLVQVLDYGTVRITVSMDDYYGAKKSAYVELNISADPKWTISSDHKTLTLSGQGTLTYSSQSSVPWSAYSNEVESVVIKKGFTAIGDYYFWEFSKLTSVTISSTVKDIGYSAFYKCTSLPSISIPASVTSIEDWTFAECSALKSVVIPSKVTSIGENAFYKCTSLASVSIPASVTSIGDNAFRECSALTSVVIPSKVTSIGYAAFYKCTSLTSVSIPASVTSIGYWAFGYCSQLKSVTIPSTVTSIGDYAFYYCESLQSVTLNKGLKTIGQRAFEFCSALKSIAIPSSVTSIGDYTFYKCESLQSVTLNKGLKTIGEYAFAQCSSLKGVTIPTSVTTIGKWAFISCSSLEKLIIPAGVTSIGESAFARRTILFVNRNSAAHTWAETNAYIYVIVDETLALPSDVKVVQDYAFYGTGAVDVFIPSGCTTIGAYAFADSKVTRVFIPDSVTSISNTAFDNCGRPTFITNNSTAQEYAREHGFKIIYFE